MIGSLPEYKISPLGLICNELPSEALFIKLQPFSIALIDEIISFGKRAYI